MTSNEKLEKLNELRAKAKDIQAELGYIALSREAQDARWAALKAELQAGEAEFRKVSDAALDPDA